MSEIKNFIELIEPHLQKQDKALKVLSFTSSNLVPAGNNYGSVILAIEVLLNDGERKQLVAKLNPPNELFKKIFNISIAFKKEAEFYSVIVPALHDFQKKNSVDILDSFPKSYGHRCSLLPEPDAFDEDACFVMENLKFNGFIATKRNDLFDLSTSKYILRSLAHFHALPIALKIKKPDVMTMIKAHLPLNYTDPDLTFYHAANVYELVTKVVKEDPDMEKYLPRIDILWKHSVKEFIAMNVLGSELFNTITHNDLWLTNILLKFDSEKKPVENKMVDFQMAAYGNPANDIIFFIHSSVHHNVISEHYQDLMDVYFEEFINKLQAYQINTAPFTKELFLKDVDSAAKCMKFYHVLFMIVTVFLEVNKDATSDCIFMSDLISSVGGGIAKQMKATVLNWVKHNWL